MILNGEWLKKFYRQTNSMQNAKLFKSILSPIAVEKCERLLENAVYSSLNNRIKKGLRAYLDGSYDNSLNVKFLFKNKIQTNEKIIEWHKRVFGEKIIGIILNSAQNVSEPIKKEFTLITEQIVEIGGIPPLGFDLGLFIGNYGYTPLGVHQDSVGFSVIHFHLGPGSKVMYLMDESEYIKEIPESIRSLPTEELINKIGDSFEKYIINPGDIFFMPPSKFHIGYTPDFSMAITLWRQESSREDYSKIFAQQISNQIINKNISKKIISSVKESQFSTHLMNHLMDEVIEINNFNVTVGKLVEISIEENKLELLSNGYFSEQGIKREGQLPGMEDGYLLNIEPFTIQLMEIDKDNLEIIVRAYKFLVPNRKSIYDFVNELNKFKLIKIDIVYKILSRDFEDDTIKHLLEQIYLCYGFEIINL